MRLGAWYFIPKPAHMDSLLERIREAAVPENGALAVAKQRYEAVCPVCGSHYDVFQSYGAPLSGKAAEIGYGLTTYMVGSGPNGEYRVISR